MSKHPRRPEPNASTPFTDVTWESLGLHYGRDQHGNRPVNWMAQHDLSVALWRTVSHWDFESAASAVEAAGSHLPVLITWTNRFGDSQVEVLTGYAIVEWVAMSPQADPRLRLRYSGFCHDVYASQVRTIEQVGVTASYEPAPASAVDTH